MGAEPPAELAEPIVPPAVLWTFFEPVRRVPRERKFVFRTNCPGTLRWNVDDGAEGERAVELAGGVMAGINYHQATLGPFGPSDRLLRFEFHCGHAHCPGHGACCKLGMRSVEIVD
jgi:hypothetical protein